MLNLCRRYVSVARNPKSCCLLGLGLWEYLGPINFQSRHKKLEKKMLKIQRYWSQKSIDELLFEADKLFNDGKFLDVYEMLNRLKFSNNTEVHWRICRCLYKMSKNTNFSHKLRLEMINEAYNLIMNTSELDKEDARIFKWMAIIAEAKFSMIGLGQKIKAFPDIAKYLEKSIELDKDDPVTLYMLGKICYDLAQLTPLERFLTRIIYGPVMETRVEDAYIYLIRSHETQPDMYYIPCIYMLAKCCITLGKISKAKLLLCSASSLLPRTPYEREFLEKSKYLLKTLDHSDNKCDSDL